MIEFSEILKELNNVLKEDARLLLYVTILVIVILCKCAIGILIVKKELKKKLNQLRQDQNNVEKLKVELQVREKVLEEKEKYLKSGILLIDKMTGEEFEEFLKVYFETQDYVVTLTKKTGDQGADLILQKDGVRTVVQAKRYDANVSNRAIQEVVSSKAVYKANEAMVITNSQYTKSAIELAEYNKVKLLDRYQVIMMITKENLKYLEEENIKFYKRIKKYTCPRCGDRLVTKNGPYGKFLSCVNQEMCSYTRSIEKE